MNIDTFVSSNSIRPSKAYTYLIQLLKEKNDKSQQRFYIRRLARKYNQTNERLNQLVKVKDSTFRAHVLNLLLKEVQDYFFNSPELMKPADPSHTILNSLSYQVVLLEMRQMFQIMDSLEYQHNILKEMQKVLQ